jgi:CheY-like chemotaxis protein
MGGGIRLIRVLLADDMPAVREIIRHGLLRGEGRYAVVGEAADGYGALTQIRSLAPDVAILDIHMPGLSGVDVVRELRRCGDETPVILCTSGEEEPLRPLPAGVVRCLRKPFRLDSLADAVEVAAAGSPRS